MSPIPAYALRPGGAPGGFSISRKTFEQIESFIADNKNSIAKSHAGMDVLVRLMAQTTKGLAQEKSMGPVAPGRRSRPELAYRIPVQRITGAYYAGWTLRRLKSGVYMLYNPTFEAYLIETGMLMRVRRPILKMSVIGMLRFIQTTRTAERFADWVLAPRRNEKGQFQSFRTRMSGSSIMGQEGPQARLP